MYHQTVARLCLIGGIALTAPPALADLTPAEVWQDWSGYMQSMGYDVAADTEADGQNLIVRDLTARASGQFGGPDVLLELGTLRFLQQSDGTVEIGMPPVMPMRIAGKMRDTQRPYAVSMRYVHEDLQLTASGSADALTYTYASPSAKVAVDRITLGDKTYESDAFSVVLQANELQSSTTMRPGALRSYDQTGRFGGISIDVAVNLPERPQSVTFAGSISNLSFSGSGMLPDLRNIATNADSLPAGLTAASALSFQGSQGEISVDHPETGRMSAMIATGQSDLEFDIGQTAGRYGYAQKDIGVALSLPNVPFPVEVSLAEIRTEFDLPLPSGEADQAFSGKASFSNLAASEAIWSVFDPSGQLPRTPVSFTADLSGNAALLPKLANIRAFQQRGLTQEVEEILEIHEVRIETDSAWLETSGFMSFNGGQANLLPGLANPVGTLKIEMAGVDALLEDLANVGILPWQAFSAARLAISMVALPGATPDTSEIVFDMTPEGAIFANGVQVR